MRVSMASAPLVPPLRTAIAGTWLIPNAAARSCSRMKLDFLDRDAIAQSGDFVEDLPGQQRGFRPADCLRKEQQRHGFGEVCEVISECLSILFRKERHGQNLKRSSNAFRASSVRGAVVSRSTVVRGANKVQVFRAFLGAMRTVMRRLHALEAAARVE